MVSWRHVLSWALHYMHGQQGSSAGARAEQRWRAHRDKQALTQSCAGTRAEPLLYTSRATPARAQSHARTRTEPPSLALLHAQRATPARAQTCSCTSNRAVH
jgi:hypothetical protein